MAKLKALPGRIKAAPARVAPLAETRAERSRLRDAVQPWRAWYHTARWQKLRWAILKRDCFTCAMCGRIEPDTSQLVCDHIEPHRGDPAKFWRGPFQCLCKACHDGPKRKAERRSLGF